jgi:hypothetical protein
MSLSLSSKDRAVGIESTPIGRISLRQVSFIPRGQGMYHMTREKRLARPKTSETGGADVVSIRHKACNLSGKIKLH